VEGGQHDVSLAIDMPSFDGSQITFSLTATNIGNANMPAPAVVHGWTNNSSLISMSGDSCTWIGPDATVCDLAALNYGDGYTWTGGAVACAVTFAVENPFNVAYTGDANDANNTISVSFCSSSDSSSSGLVCGNGAIDEGEDCDSYMLDTPECDANCTNAQCGDGYVNAAAGESCDSFGVDVGGCDGNECVIPVCSDGHVNGPAGEACDDSDNESGDGCTSSCNIEYGYYCTGEPSVCVTSCGDAIVAGTEQCDDSGYNTSTCDIDCTMAVCGDGFLNTLAVEQCDAAGVDTASCDTNCTFATCGDGYTNSAAGEACDAMGEAPGCDDDCTEVVCGDGNMNMYSEQCDDGNQFDNDGCSSMCQLEEAPPAEEEIIPEPSIPEGGGI
jgi:cysteine-rich repeat protein